MGPAYRADRRSLGEVVDAGGYKPWYPVGIEVVRDLLQYVAGVKTWDDCLFKPVAEKFRFDFPPKPLKKFTSKDLVPKTDCDPVTFHEWVIRTGDKGPTISTAITDDCGGKSGNILRIDCTDIGEVPWSAAVPGGIVTVRKQTPRLLLNAQLLMNATVIALESQTNAKERTFLTPIEVARLSLHKAA